jgi:N-acylglucosamine-6-phosphate 2-epimerase
MASDFARDVLQRLRGGLVASCQADEGSPLRAPVHIVAMANAAIMGGAVALRIEGIEGIENIAAVRQAVDVPIIGIVKARVADGSVHITPTIEDVRRIAGAGAEIVAFDATHRAHPDSVSDLCAAVHSAGVIAMADISTAIEAGEALAASADFVGTTLAGYTPHSNRTLGPDFILMQELRAAGFPFAAEGRVWTPDEAQMCLQLGAQFVVVGSAITRPDQIARRFAGRMAVPAN